ncbi:MAG: hypothetical protein PHH30_12015, partial [Bacteroidales bacterium]|nr:hypothetical protein [Bacteroidales bacterium]
NTPLRFLHKEKSAITLINKDYHCDFISEESTSNLIKVLKSYKKTISFHKTDHIVATATSGIRSSSNKDYIINAIKSQSGLNVKVIDGNAEAELVWKGVKNAVKLYSNPVLIIDIGGGSIEFVICNDVGIIRKSSFNIGVARLILKYKYSDPLSSENITNIHQLLKSELENLLFDCKKYSVKTLIGSSGSYETFANLIKHECQLCNISDSESANILNIKSFLFIYDKLITYNEVQRTEMPGMEIIRVKMIPIAAVITKFILEELRIETLIQSNFSIKEGTLFDYIDKINGTE